MILLFSFWKTPTICTVIRKKDLIFENAIFLFSRRCDPRTKENRRLLACSVSYYLVLLLEKSAVALAYFNGYWLLIECYLCHARRLLDCCLIRSVNHAYQCRLDYDCTIIMGINSSSLGDCRAACCLCENVSCDLECVNLCHDNYLHAFTFLGSVIVFRKCNFLLRDPLGAPMIRCFAKLDFLLNAPQNFLIFKNYIFLNAETSDKKRSALSALLVECLDHFLIFLI